METTRWFRRAGPGILSIGALAVIASAVVGAPDRTWRPTACDGPAPVSGKPAGAWYRIDPVLADGTRIGQRLAVGSAGDERPRMLDLDAESFAAGPFDGAVLVGSDDGRATRLFLIDVAAGCARAITQTSDVVRRATLSVDGRSIYEHRVDRDSRADLGVWRREVGGASRPVRVLEPLAPDDRFGPTWLTSFTWDDTGSTLAVQSCGEVACRIRSLDVATGKVRLVADPTLGTLIGITPERLVASGACRGLPCPIVSVDIDGGPTVILADAAGQAVLVADDDGVPVIVYEADADGRSIRRVDVDGQRRNDMDLPSDGRRLVPAADRAESAAATARGWVLFGPDGRLPIDGRTPAIYRHVPDGRAVQLDEVPQ
jgi:hypothetical protein